VALLDRAVEVDPLTQTGMLIWLAYGPRHGS